MPVFSKLLRTLYMSLPSIRDSPYPSFTKDVSTILISVTANPRIINISKIYTIKSVNSCYTKISHIWW